MSGEDNAQSATAAAAVSGGKAGDNELNKNNVTSSGNDRNNKDQFRVQVQSQYLTSVRPSILAPFEPKTDTPEDSNKNSSKNKKRGQNKKRPRDTKISTDQKTCLQIIKGESCPFENCKYNHDLKEMMANRLPDLCEEEGVEWLRGECPNWKLRG